MADAEAAAAAAQQVRGTILCPLYSSPKVLRDSYEALVSNIGEEEAAEILRKNPAVLTCGEGLRDADPDEIRRLASAREVLDKIPPEVLLGVTLLVSAVVVGKIALIKLGYDAPIG